MSELKTLRRVISDRIAFSKTGVLPQSCQQLIRKYDDGETSSSEAFELELKMLNLIITDLTGAHTIFRAQLLAHLCARQFLQELGQRNDKEALEIRSAYKKKLQEMREGNNEKKKLYPVFFIEFGQDTVFKRQTLLQKVLHSTAYRDSEDDMKNNFSQWTKANDEAVNQMLLELTSLREENAKLKLELRKPVVVGQKPAFGAPPTSASASSVFYTQNFLQDRFIPIDSSKFADTATASAVEPQTFEEDDYLTSI
jgi:hypothetical protein